MTIDIKELIKSHVSVSKDKSDVQVSLNQVKEGEWELARKSEFKRDVYAIPNESNLFLEVKLSRAGEYHSDYTYGKPTFELVEKKTEHVISYPAVINFDKEKAKELKEAHFNNHDETKLTPVYDSGAWKYAHKAHYWESVFDIDGILLKQTLIGNCDWTEFVEYEIVQKKEEDIVSFIKVKA